MMKIPFYYGIFAHVSFVGDFIDEQHLTVEDIYRKWHVALGDRWRRTIPFESTVKVKLEMITLCDGFLEHLRSCGLGS